MTTLAEHISSAQVVVCCGSGGVGKTTVAAALGLQAARMGRRGNEPIRLGIDAPGELWALMLDTASTFDGLVSANAETPEQAERILNNGFYRNIAGSLSGTQEYMAAERLHALHGDERFDLVIIDTPPTRNALDFLDAPNTLTKFIDHPLFKMLMLPTRRGLKVLNVAAQPILRTIGKVVGGDALADAIAFFQAFAGMETGFRRRAEEVMTLLHDDVSRFVLVASPRADTIEEARYFADRLQRSNLAVAATVVNRCTPTFGDLPAIRPDEPELAALYDNLAELKAAAVAEREQASALLAEEAVHTTWVATLPGDVHSLAALGTIRSMLFD